MESCCLANNLHNNMIFGERTVPMIVLAGHLSTLERHEAANINEALSGKSGFSFISDTLKNLGFKIGDKDESKKYILTRADDTKINNAFLIGNHEGMRVQMNKAFSPASLIEQSKYGPGHLYDLFNKDDD